MLISNVFQTYQDIEPGDQLLFTMKAALSTDLETEFQYSRSLVLSHSSVDSHLENPSLMVHRWFIDSKTSLSDASSQSVSKDWYYLTWPVEEPVDHEINHFHQIVDFEANFEILK